MYRNRDQRDFARRLRNLPSGTERGLWRFLRAGQIEGHKFRRQAAVGAFIVDFVCFEQQCVVELDGPQHFEPASLEYDARRTAWLMGEGFRVIRFRNHEVDEDVLMVVERIREALQAPNPTPLPSPLPNPPHRGEGTGRDNR